jgi:hypothetical protein
MQAIKADMAFPQTYRDGYGTDAVAPEGDAYAHVC